MSNPIKNAVDPVKGKFEVLQAKNIAKANKVLENYNSSSESEDEVDEKTILESLYKHYEAPSNNAEQYLKKTTTFLENLLHSGAATCLICIGSVRRADAIWSCKHCYCFFHLNCIKRWANDSIAQLKTKQRQQQTDQGYYNHLGEFIAPKKTTSLHWCCPQCRLEYEPKQRPTDYMCFCGTEVNPQIQPWLVPHSCGEICSKKLLQDCGHKCMLLCHPGPCPPCAQYAVTSCLCGMSPVKSVRCMDKQWQCSRKCNKRLSCSEHVCNQLCHKPGQCPPCTSTSMQRCECNRAEKLRNCSSLKWNCQQVCGKNYSCGLHTCTKVCHSGPCGDCPLGMPRSCPCGKTKKIGPCTESIDSCGDTCQKLLVCGLHTCAQRCHRGNCNLCLVITKKKCRCGKYDKDLPCSKEFTCDTKCKQMRDCNKHPCNKKCCDGNCASCDKVCGKTLSCKKHKCQSICHEGPCYPCERQSQVNCRCGKTSRSVPCGRERTARVLCLEPCRIPSKCHHASKHRCHKHECPPCNQICNLPNDTTVCGHICEAKCHASVKGEKKEGNMKSKFDKWDKSKKIELKTLPHPQCEKMVMVRCIGGHELAEWPCWNSKPTSCHRRCNRDLQCGNHKCERECHAVANIDDMKEQIGCATCPEGCNIPRPTGCIHPCPLVCHLPPCTPCNVIIKAKCHCGLTQVIYKCSEYYNAEGLTENSLMERQERLKSCGNRCLKNFPCAHRCNAICHSGKCPNPETCRKKVRIFCACKRLKLEIACDKLRNGLTELPCDEQCMDQREKLKRQQLQEAEALRLQEETKNRIELEQFEKKFGRRKPKERKQLTEKTLKQINWKLISIYVSTAMAILLAIAVAFYEDK